LSDDYVAAWSNDITWEMWEAREDELHPLIEANAEAVPLPDDSFDLVHLLRPGGHLVFLRNSTVAMLCATAEGPTAETLQRVDHSYYTSNAEWAKKWPSEEIWRARKTV
jgi:hypothetical protein